MQVRIQRSEAPGQVPAGKPSSAGSRVTPPGHIRGVLARCQPTCPPWRVAADRGEPQQPQDYKTGDRRTASIPCHHIVSLLGIQNAF